MEKKNFQSCITAGISPLEATKKISKVPDWWGVTFSGDSEKQNDRFIVKMGGDSFFNFTITELIPGKRVVWLVTDCHMPWYSNKKEWAHTKLIFDLSESDGGTMVSFTHEGLTPDVECYKDCETGWSHWIRTSLLSYFTTGKGQFKQRKMVKYSVSVELPKPSGEIFSHLLRDVSQFWPEDFKGESSKLNDEFIFTTGETHYSKNKVAELVPGKKVVWLVTDSIRKTDNYNWTGTKMIFELTPEGDHTHLQFTYDGPVLENEYERLVQICDVCIKEMFYNFVVNNRAKKM
ncbi:MAG TPA: SRPBCC family protein [Chitinophagaceae bacterium]|nr:SRPBCC family protein [Chitinophagaceae bacterium]